MILKALKTNKLLTINYQNNGFVQTVKGYIQNLNLLEQTLLLKDENQNVIKIVHGKGPEAILKTYVNGWLRQHRDVLAFVSAPDNQGGTGAVLVLLKRTEKNPKYKQ